MFDRISGLEANSWWCSMCCQQVCFGYIGILYDSNIGSCLKLFVSLT